MQKKLCGIDLNGVQDYAARNWVKAPSGEDEFVEHVNLGSTRSSIIDLNIPKGFPEGILVTGCDSLADALVFCPPGQHQETEQQVYRLCF